MSGHSHWSTIQRTKGREDARRGVTFTKIANMITIASRLGNSGDPASNPRLRLALENARNANMPKENIQRAIDRGLGKLPGQTLEEVLFEGFGPSKVVFLVEGITDNKMRTLSEVRNLFERSGGSLGSQGSATHIFDKKGEIVVKSKGGNVDEEMLELIDLGAEDVEELKETQEYLVYCDIANINLLSKSFTQAGYQVENPGIIYKPNLVIKVSQAEAQKVLDLAEKLEEHSDISKVYMNAEFPNDL